MALSLLSTLYLGYTWPYKERVQNRLSMFNETAILIIAYLVMVLVGISEQVRKKQSAGEIITNCLYATWVVNFVTILTILFI